MFNFDEEHHVLLDEMNIQLSKADVLDLAEKCRAHLAHSDLELMALGRISVERKGEGISQQFNFDYYP